MLIQKGPVFPFQQKKPDEKQATHEDPGDFINGVRVPKEGQREREVATENGGRVLLCGICGLRECPYTVEI